MLLLSSGLLNLRWFLIWSKLLAALAELSEVHPSQWMLRIVHVMFCYTRTTLYMSSLYTALFICWTYLLTCWSELILICARFFVSVCIRCALDPLNLLLHFILLGNLYDRVHRCFGFSYHSFVLHLPSNYAFSCALIYASTLLLLMYIWLVVQMNLTMFSLCITWALVLTLNLLRIDLVYTFTCISLLLVCDFMVLFCFLLLGSFVVHIDLCIFPLTRALLSLKSLASHCSCSWPCIFPYNWIDARMFCVCARPYGVYSDTLCMS